MAVQNVARSRANVGVFLSNPSLLEMVPPRRGSNPVADDLICAQWRYHSYLVVREIGDVTTEHAPVDALPAIEWTTPSPPPLQ